MLENYLKKFSLIAAIGVLSLCPLLINANFIFPFMHLKNIVFRLIVWLLMIPLAWLLLKKKAIIGKKNYVFLAFILFLGVQFLASIFGVNFANSIWGNFERMDGFFNLLTIGLYFFLLINIIENKQEWLWFFRSSVLSSIVISVGVIFYKLDISNYLSQGDAATIGNIDFVGVYLLFNIFFAAILLIADENKNWRLFFAGVLLLDVFVLFLNAARGSIVGLLVAVFLMMFAYSFKATKKIKIALAVTALTLLIIFAVIYWQKSSDFVQNIPALRRLTNISLQDTSTNNRLLVWRVTFNAFLERPILGYGPENAIYGINKYYNPMISEQWFDRAHSFVFDYLGSSGILGLFSYLLILVVASIYLIKYSSKNYRLATLLLGSLSAYLTANFFVFDTINTWLLLCLTLAFISFLGTKDSSDNDFKIKDFLVKNNYLIIGAIALVCIIAMYYGAILPARQNLLLANALRYSNIDPQKSLNYYKSAYDIGFTGRKETAMQLGSYMNAIMSESDKYNVGFRTNVFSEVEREFSEVLKYDKDIRLSLLLAQVYLEYSPDNPYYIDEAINVVNKYLELSPNRVENYTTLAQAYYLKKDYSQAVEYLEKSLALNKDKKSTYFNIINVSSQNNDVKRVNDYVDKLLTNFSYIESDEYRKIAQAYFRVKENEKAKDLLRNKAIPANPSDVGNYISYASILESEGKINQAKDYLNDIIAQNPQMTEDVSSYINTYLNK